MITLAPVPPWLIPSSFPVSPCMSFSLLSICSLAGVLRTERRALSTLNEHPATQPKGCFMIRVSLLTLVSVWVKKKKSTEEISKNGWL